MLFINRRVFAKRKIKTENRELDPLIGKGAITINLVTFYIVVCLSWYMLQTGAVTFGAIVSLVNHIVTGFFTEFLSLTSSQALLLLFTQTGTIYHEIAKYFHLFTIFLISIGVLDLLLRWRRKGVDDQYQRHRREEKSQSPETGLAVNRENQDRGDRRV